MRKMIDPVAFLQEMVGIYSPTGQESELAGFLVSRMQELASGPTGTRWGTPSAKWEKAGAP